MKKRNWKMSMVMLAVSAMLAGCAIQKEEEVSTEEPSSVIALTSEATEEAEPKVDWAEHYKDFFRSYDLDNTMMTLDYQERSSNGLIIRLTQRRSEGKVWLHIEFEEKEPTGNYMDVYTDEQGMVYFKSQIRDNKPVLSKASGILSEAEASLGIDNPVLFEEEDFLGATYDREITEEDIVYDVLYARILHKTTTAANRYIKYYFYVNRETQKLEKITLQDAGAESVCYVTPIDGLEIPEEILNAKKEKKQEDFLLLMGREITKLIMEAKGVKADGMDKLIK